jgi:hypothetical protein
MQLNLDKGSEIGWQVAFQIALRCVTSLSEQSIALLIIALQ